MTSASSPGSRRNQATAPTTLRWSQWQFATAVAVLVVGICLIATFWLPGILGSHVWLPLGDGPTTVQSAQFVANGGLPWIYSANAGFLTLPGFLLILAPATAIGNHLNLLNDTPYQIAHPSMWLVITPVFFLCGASAVLGVDYLADTLAITQARRRVIALAVGLLVVVPTCCLTGHPEDLLSLALCAAAVSLILRGRQGAAAGALGLALLMQLWAIVLVPLLVATAPPRMRFKVLLQSCAPAGSMALLLLAFDFKDAYRSLIIQPMFAVQGQRLPWWALTHQTRIWTDSGSMMVRVGSLPRSLAVLLAIGAAMAVSRRPEPSRVIAVSAFALVSRGIFEAQIWPYYLAAGAVFMLIGAAAFTDRGDWRWPLVALATLIFYGASAGTYARETYPSVVAFAILIVTGIAGLSACRPRPCLRRTRIAPQLPQPPTQREVAERLSKDPGVHLARTDRSPTTPSNALAATLDTPRPETLRL